MVIGERERATKVNVKLIDTGKCATFDTGEGLHLFRAATEKGDLGVASDSPQNILSPRNRYQAIHITSPFDSELQEEKRRDEIHLKQLSLWNHFLFV